MNCISKKVRKSVRLFLENEHETKICISGNLRRVFFFLLKIQFAFLVNPRKDVLCIEYSVKVVFCYYPLPTYYFVGTVVCKLCTSHGVKLLLE